MSTTAPWLNGSEDDNYGQLTSYILRYIKNFRWVLLGPLNLATYFGTSETDDIALEVGLQDCMLRERFELIPLTFSQVSCTSIEEWNGIGFMLLQQDVPGLCVDGIAVVMTRLAC